MVEHVARKIEYAGEFALLQRVSSAAAAESAIEQLLKIRLARATMTNIRQNIAIALGLKSVFLMTTLFGITGLWIAILADTGATVIVTLNALRLLFFRPSGPSETTGQARSPTRDARPERVSATT